MIRVWRKSATNEVYYDSTAKKVLTTGYPCQWCVANEIDTPEAVKVTLEGLLCCAGVGNCGLGGFHRFKFSSLGIGLNFENVILLRGRHVWNETTGKWDCYGPEGEGVWGYCYWSNVVYDDFGTYHHYNLDNCAGGIDYTVNLTSRHVRVVRGGETWWVRVSFHGPKGSPVPPTGVAPAFDYNDSDFVNEEEVCVPYGEYENENECPNTILGNGTLTIEEV